MEALNDYDHNLNVKLVLLQKTYETMEATYENASRWASVLIGAWAVLMGITIASLGRLIVSGLLLTLCGFVLLILWHEFRRAGQGLSGLWTVAMSLERDLGIPVTRSHVTASLATFRKSDYIDEISRVSRLEEQSEWIQELGSGQLGVFRLNRSLTMKITLIVAIVLLTTGLLMFGYASLLAIINFVNDVLAPSVPVFT